MSPCVSGDISRIGIGDHSYLHNGYSVSSIVLDNADGFSK